MDLDMETIHKSLKLLIMLNIDIEDINHILYL